MFREVRNSKIDDKEALEILTCGEYGVLSSTGADGYAYGIPINYAYLNGSIYVHGSTIGHRIDNIKHCPLVSFCVVDNVKVLPDKFDTLFRSTIVFGKGELVDDNEEKRAALIALIEKYSSDHMDAGIDYIENLWEKTSIVRISIEHMTGKAQK